MRRTRKLLTDGALTLSLLLLMSYGMVGEATHEWIDVSMLILSIAHHIWNRKWLGALRRGRYTAFRTVQTILACAVLVCMLGSMSSGIMLSRHVFRLGNISGLTAWAQTAHMTCAYWGFAMMSLHLGLHWNMVISSLARRFKAFAPAWSWITWILAFGIAGYGVYAFFTRDFSGYLLMKLHFVFYDYSEPLIFFLLDYLAIMGLCVLIGYYLGRCLRRSSRTASEKAGDFPD